jgi:hypothetical protein
MAVITGSNIAIPNGSQKKMAHEHLSWAIAMQALARTLLLNGNNAPAHVAGSIHRWPLDGQQQAILWAINNFMYIAVPC